MDPPDILGVDPSAARPTQLPGRAKSEWLFSFLLPISYAKPPPLYLAARMKDWTLSFLSVCWHLLFAELGVMGHVVTWLYATASSVGGWWLCLAGLCPAALRPSPLSPPSLL